MVLLLHNDFADQIEQTLNIFGVTPIPDFDPLDPVYLKDPKYEDLSEDGQAQKEFEYHCYRMLKAVENLRSPVKYAVAISFAVEGWIPSKEMKNLFNKNNAHNNNLFHRSGSNRSMSFNDATTSVSTMSPIGHDFE